jgi:hypothetical protein
MKTAFVKVLRILGIFSAVLIAVSACDEHLESEPGKTAKKLKTKNPFEASIVVKAWQNVVAKTPANGRTNLAAPSTTHNYIRFEPQDVDQLLYLHNLGYELFDVPLHEGLEDHGEFYQDPNAGEITYQYTLIPTNYHLTTQVPYTHLGQVILFDEFAGDEQDEWIPDPDPGSGYCYDEWGQAYLCGTDPRVFLRTKEQKLPEDLYQKTTRTLLEQGIDLTAMFNEMMELAGLPDEQITSNSAGRTNRFRPAGRIRVMDNVTGQALPVKGIKVSALRFFKIAQGFTDVNGYFMVSKEFRQKASLRLLYQNTRGTIRGINGALKLWEYAAVLEKELGTHSGPIDYTLTYATNAETYGAIQWAAAHCLNTLHEMYEYSAARGIPNPYGYLNIWISSKVTDAASAPMLSGIANSSLADQLIQAKWPNSTIGSTIFKIVKNWLPDVTLRLQNQDDVTRFAPELSRTFFHEFGHTQHYSQVGNGYWYNYIFYILANRGYGTKTSTGVGRVAVGEAWGFFIGSTFNRTKYENLGRFDLAADERNFLEFQRPNDQRPVQNFNGIVSQGWIPWGLLHDLGDTGEPVVTFVDDQVNTYALATIFSAFTDNATDVNSLRNNLLLRNDYRQQQEVNTLVTSYGW